MKKITLALLFTGLLACKMKDTKTIGSIETSDPKLEAIVNNGAEVEVIGVGFKWSEGPVWIEEEEMLLFSDVPANTIHKWTTEKGTEVYLTPSGFTGTGSYSKEPGANGLTLTSNGRLVLCQHGDRKVSMMDAPLNQPKPSFITLADRYEGKKFNSPNDVVFRSNGDMFFTDPPYGLPTQSEDDPSKEIPFQGVYKVSNGNVSLIIDSLTRPNGLAFLPGEKTLIVANSDPAKAIWYALELGEDDTVTNARIFYDATSNSRAGEKGLPDGLKVDKEGNVFATGPGGVWIFNKDGKVLGRIKITEPTSNCALADNDKTLYITANMYVARVRLRN